MTAEDAYRRVAEQLPPDLVGRFYSPGETVGLGKGKIYDDLAYPIYEPEQGTFATAAGLAYVLTHECDVEPANERLFNEELLVCPIVPLQHLVEVYEADLPGELLPSLLGNLGARLVSRLVFLPAITERLPFGGVMYLNQITNTHVSAFDGATPICAVTTFGLQHIEYGIENHLLRPKDDRLAFGE